MAVFLREASPGERLLRAALDHFDRILTQREFQSLMQQEMMRLHKGEEGALPILVKTDLRAAARDVPVDGARGHRVGRADRGGWLQIVLAALGANVFYFLSAPVWRLVMPIEPFDPRCWRRGGGALVEFLGQAIFQDRQHGAELAARVLADTPMPELRDGAIQKEI